MKQKSEKQQVKEIGNRIGKIRKNKDLTQEGVAKKLNMTTSAYSKIERGYTNAPLNRLFQIANVLDVNIVEFFIDASNKNAFATKADMDHLSSQVNFLLKKIKS